MQRTIGTKLSKEDYIKLGSLAQEMNISLSLVVKLAIKTINVQVVKDYQNAKSIQSI